MRTKRLLILGVAMFAIAAAACGGDDAGDAGGGAAKPAAPGAPKPGAPGAGSALVPRMHVEDRVPPAERATIRHVFRERDFVADTNRDPFQSFVVLMPGTPTGPASVTTPSGSSCSKEQLVATNYSYADLKLIGIGTQGTQSKVLMMDPHNLGHIIRRGDCVGKEKALVRDIGAGYITFVITPEQAANSPIRPPEEHSVQLHPADLPIDDQLFDEQQQQQQLQQQRPAVAPVLPPTGPAPGSRPGLAMPAPVPEAVRQPPAANPPANPSIQIQQPPAQPAPTGPAPAPVTLQPGSAPSP